MSKHISGRALCALILAGAFVAAPALADEWAPSKTVRIVVPVIGGTNDVLARLVAPELQKALGQTVIVENKAGAGGTIAADEVAKSAPDGHTLLIGYNGPIAVNQTLFAKLPYDPVKDLMPITLAVRSGQVLAVHPSVPAKSLAEFVSLAKSEPGKLSYGSVSMGSASHLTMEMLKSAAGIDLVHIPYKGAAPAVAALLAGQIQAAFQVPDNVKQFADVGRVRLIASTGEKRFASMPDIPTVIEQGYPGFVAMAWIGFLTPSGTPQPIIDRYNKEIVRILHLPEVRGRLEQMDFEIVASSPEDFADWIDTEIVRWGKIVKATGARVE